MSVIAARFREPPLRIASPPSTMVAPSPPDPFRVAADAVTRLAQTLAACAREVEDRGGQRTARGMLRQAKRDARRDLIVLYESLRAVRRPHAAPGSPAGEVFDMLEGCREGFVRETWALRIMAMRGERPTDPGQDAEVDRG